MPQMNLIYIPGNTMNMEDNQPHLGCEVVIVRNGTQIFSHLDIHPEVSEQL
jgi:hypothetical protein